MLTKYHIKTQSEVLELQLADDERLTWDTYDKYLEVKLEKDGVVYGVFAAEYLINISKFPRVTAILSYAVEPTTT